MPKTGQKARKTSDAVRILDSMIGEDSHLQQLAGGAMVNAEVAQLIYDGPILSVAHHSASR